MDGGRVRVFKFVGVFVDAVAGETLGSGAQNHVHAGNSERYNEPVSATVSTRTCALSCQQSAFISRTARKNERRTVFAWLPDFGSAANIPDIRLVELHQLEQLLP